MSLEGAVDGFRHAGVTARFAQQIRDATTFKELLVGYWTNLTRGRFKTDDTEHALKPTPDTQRKPPAPVPHGRLLPLSGRKNGKSSAMLASHAMMEPFHERADNASISALLAIVASKQGCEAHGECSDEQSCLAAFLIGAGERSYYGQLQGGWSASRYNLRPPNGALFWAPLGEPDSTATLTAGNLWTRSFNHGKVEVEFCITNNVGTITGLGNWTSNITTQPRSSSCPTPTPPPTPTPTLAPRPARPERDRYAHRATRRVERRVAGRGAGHTALPPLVSWINRCD